MGRSPDFAGGLTGPASPPGCAASPVCVWPGGDHWASPLTSVWVLGEQVALSSGSEVEVRTEA